MAYRFTLFGGLGVVRGATPVPVGARKRAAVLAQLLLAQGRTVSATGLITGVWGDDVPEAAGATLQAHVSVLRRALEPDRTPRAPAQVLVTRGSGYALVLPRESVDVWRFTDAVEQAQRLHSRGRLEEAAVVLQGPLREHGPLLPDFEGFRFQDEAVQHLERIHRAALEIYYDVRVPSGEERLLVAELETAARRRPLDEGLWYLLAVARYRAGSQSDALGALAESRRALTVELGIDPSPRMRQLEHDILSQASHLHLPRLAAPLPVAGGAASSDDQDVQRHLRAFVGRPRELAGVQEALRDAAAGRDAVVVVEGDSGIGKTALLSEAAHQARSDGQFDVLWGSCAEGAGTPSMWPWTAILRSALQLVPQAEREQALGPELDRFTSAAGPHGPPSTSDPAARFRLFDQAAALLRRVASQRPLLLVVDDLQWADAASLDLAVHLAAHRAPGVVLLAAVRTDLHRENETFVRAMAALARSAAVRRIALGALSHEEIGELLQRETGSRPLEDLVRAVASRSRGNPFYVRELAHVLRDGSDVARAAEVPPGVPVGVRDVVRARLSALGAGPTEVVQLAALMGQRVDLEVLARSAGRSLEDVLTALAPAEALRLLEPVRDDPFCVSFAHDLVRDAVAETVTPSAQRRMHLRIADALEAGCRAVADTSERLAFHLWSAGPLASRARTAAAFIEAGQASLAKFAYEAAELQLDSAVQLAHAAGEPVLELRALQLQTSVIAILHRYVDGPPALLAHAERRAAALGFRREEADFLFTRWSIASQYIDLSRASALAAKLGRIADESGDRVTRIYAEHADGFTQWDRGRIGDAYRAFSRGAALLGDRLLDPQEDGDLRPDLRLVLPAFLAHLTVLHVGVGPGAARFEALARTIGDDRYGRAVWHAVAATSASMAGDPRWALRVSGVGEEQHATEAFEFVSVFAVYLAGWARALSGEPVQGVARMRATIADVPDVDAVSGYPLWLTLLAEALLADGRFDEVEQELDAADQVMARTGQRYAEPLALLVRAQLAQARGESELSVDLLSAARSLAETTEATLLLERIDRFTRTRVARSH